MGEKNRDAHRRVDGLHDAHHALGGDDQAPLANPGSRAGTQGDREVVDATASLERLSRDEAPLQLASQAEDLPEAIVLRFQSGNARGGEGECIATQLFTLRGQIRATPFLGAALQPHERRDERPTETSRNRFTQVRRQHLRPHGY